GRKRRTGTGPRPGQEASQRPPSRGVTGPAGGLPGARRRQTPMVASKPAADGLVTSGEPPPPSVQRGAPGGIAEPAFATNPYARVGRIAPCHCGRAKNLQNFHGEAV